MFLLVGRHECLPSLMETSRKPNGIRCETRNLLNIDHGKALAPHREVEANLSSVSQFIGCSCLERQVICLMIPFRLVMARVVAFIGLSAIMIHRVERH